ADGGSGGTYAVTPELFLRIMELMRKGEVEKAREIQYAVDSIIFEMGSCRGNLYAVMKEILRIRENLDIGDVRKPLPSLVPEDMPQVKRCAEMITAAVDQFCGK
ncbi:MAG: N-acetylneuraminate lyase, partial [Lachnospiraceae bacterium]|nr:N-acetylneuraminate lyase [Lachnospiraceae bacterium]